MPNNNEKQPLKPLGWGQEINDLKSQLMAAREEIERLRAPHPTCETCIKISIPCSIRWAGNGCTYCSEHTALNKKGNG